MPKVKFTKLFDWPIPGSNNRQSIQFRPGMRELVTTPCAEAAVAGGFAEWIERPEPEPVPVPEPEPEPAPVKKPARNVRK